MIHNRLKFTSMLLAPRGRRVRSMDWLLSQPGFDLSYGKLICLASLWSSDRTKQTCLWMTIYDYIATSTLSLPSFNLKSQQIAFLSSFLFKLLILVKGLIPEKFGGMHSSWSLIRILSMLYHPYLLQVIGFCQNVLVTLKGKTFQSTTSITEYNILFHNFPTSK